MDLKPMALSVLLHRQRSLRHKQKLTSRNLMIQMMRIRQNNKNEILKASQQSEQINNKNLPQEGGQEQQKDKEMAPNFRIGAKVAKPSGYPFPGTVLAAFHVSSGEMRYVVESDDLPGLLHIFSPSQLELQ